MERTTILVDAGYCVYSSPCDYIDGDFGGTSEKSLEDFIGKKSLKTEDLTVLEDKMIEKVEEEGKSFVDTSNKVEDSIKRRDKKLKEKYGIHLEYLTPEMAEYFRKWFRHDKALDVTGEDIEKDIVKYISKKEGGMTDTGTDKAESHYMPYEYDTENKILTYKGKKYKLTGKDLPPKTRSRKYGSKLNPKYSSDRWHTNRGIVWEYFSEGKPDTVQTVIDWLNTSDEDLKDYYIKKYYNDKYSSNDLVNHFFALVKWGSGDAKFGPTNLQKRILEKTDSGSIDEAIEKLGLPVVFDLMVKERGDQFHNMGQKQNEKGWMNSLVNFHYYFYEKYIKPIADQVPDEVSDEIIDVIDNPKTEEEIDMVLDLPEVVVDVEGSSDANIHQWFDLEDFKSHKDTIVPNIFGRGIPIKKGEVVPDHLRSDDDNF